MARIECPKCVKTFKKKSGLAWHTDRSHESPTEIPGDREETTLEGSNVEYESFHSELEALQSTVDGISENHDRYSEMQNHIASINEQLQAIRIVLDKVQVERQIRDSTVDQRLDDLRELGQIGANAQKDVVALANYVKSEVIPAVDNHSHERKLMVYPD